MDNHPERTPTLRFGPDRRWVAAIAVAAVLAVAIALRSTDPVGRTLIGTAAVLLAGLAVSDLVFWPRLAVDRSGIRIRSPLARVELAWADVAEVRSDVSLYHGLRSSTLEVDDGERLFVLSRRALNADPEQVAELMRACDPRR